MHQQTLSIPIVPVQGGVGCGSCLQSFSGPICRSTLGDPCAAPALSGPPELLQKLMAALEAAWGGIDEVPATRWVHALKMTPGEVELTLAFGPRCGGAQLADAAFQTLRALLPDTDIYVTHAAP